MFLLSIKDFEAANIEELVSVCYIALEHCYSSVQFWAKYQIKQPKIKFMY